MKPRRDITLGEMQDECLKQGISSIGAASTCKGCPYELWCGANGPDGWDLTDPPRFNEAQMALLKGLYACGCVTLIQDHGLTSAQSKDGDAMWFGKMLNLKSTETLDIAELLGEGADK